jgi:signal peptidase I
MKDEKAKSTGKRIAKELGEIVLAFVVAWLGYQALALATGTTMPIVAVVSESMYHTNEFDGWWLQHGSFYKEIGINMSKFQAFPFRSGLSKGDLLLVVNQQPQVGDVVIYDRPGQGFTIVHRVISMTNGEYVTKGDNNYVADQSIAKNQIKGKVVLAVPLLGFPRFLLFAFGV